MKAAWYDRQGPAGDVLVVGEMPDPAPGQGEVRIAVHSSGINPGEVKKRSDAFGVGMPFPRVIPHNDGSGVIDAVGPDVTSLREGDRVWCFGAQSYRPFGTAADYAVLPVENVARLPDAAPFEVGACLGIPGLTAHQAVHVGGPVEGRTLLVQGGAGSVGVCAVAIARHGGAQVLATVRSSADEDVAWNAGAHEVIRTDQVRGAEVVDRIRRKAPGGVDHIVEVAFHANIAIDHEILNQRGSIAAYATGDPNPPLPFWPMVFKNLRLFLLGSDDFLVAEKRVAAETLTAMLESGWRAHPIAQTLPLQDIARAHELVEGGTARGRVLLDLTRRALPQKG